MTSHISSRPRGSRPGRGFVEEQDPWLAAERAGEIEPAAHAARVRLDHAIRGIGEPELLEQLGGAPASPRSR